MKKTKMPVWTKQERKKLIEANMPSVLKVAERYKKEGEYKEKDIRTLLVNFFIFILRSVLYLEVSNESRNT